MHSIKILSTRIDNISLDEVPSILNTFLNDKNQHQLITANSLMLLETIKDVNLKIIFDEASLVIPESSGVFWAAEFLKTPLKEKIPGIDFMIFLLSYAQENNHSAFFLGTKEDFIVKAIEKIKEMFPKLKIAGYNNGYFLSTEQSLISKIKSSNPEILFVGLTIPFQEKWIYNNLKSLGVKIAIGVGGSFDVLSGDLKRAPLWMRNTGIEWAFRVLQQPWRIKRILKLFIFIWKIFCEKFRSYSLK